MSALLAFLLLAQWWYFSQCKRTYAHFWRVYFLKINFCARRYLYLENRGMLFGFRETIACTERKPVNEKNCVHTRERTHTHIHTHTDYKIWTRATTQEKNLFVRMSQGTSTQSTSATASTIATNYNSWRMALCVQTPLTAHSLDSEFGYCQR